MKVHLLLLSVEFEVVICEKMSLSEKIQGSDGVMCLGSYRQRNYHDWLMLLQQHSVLAQRRGIGLAQRTMTQLIEATLAQRQNNGP